VSFMGSLSRTEAESFFEHVLEGVLRAERILLAAFVDSKLVGTVQILISMPPKRVCLCGVILQLGLTRPRRFPPVPCTILLLQSLV
jgi:hypothetical protein